MRPWPYSPKFLTVDDVVATGACHEGVMDFVEKQSIFATRVSSLKLAKNFPNEVHILKAAGLIGYGYGDGYGDGSGYGYGSGSGYGYGYGYGYGDGSGSGDGDGYGYGYGYGDGYGYGYGDGYGYGPL